MSGARTEPAEVCGGNMKIISFIEQEEVIRRILVHCDLWNEPPVRPPPVQLSAEPVHRKRRMPVTICRNMMSLRMADKPSEDGRGGTLCGGDFFRLISGRNGSILSNRGLVEDLNSVLWGLPGREFGNPAVCMRQMALRNSGN